MGEDATSDAVSKSDEQMQDEESKYDEESQTAESQTTNVDYVEDIDDALKNLKIGAVEKLFRLRNDVMTSTIQILKYCQPVELGYKTEKYAANLLKDANATAIKWGNLKQCKHISFKLVQRVSKMLEQITDKVDLLQLPKKRVANINAIIAQEEEQNKDGLISLLERAYNIISDVRKVIGSTLHQTELTTDDMAAREYENYSVPFWEAQSAKFRILFEQEKEMKQKIQMIDILREQNVKEKEKSTALATTQNENTKLTQKNDKFKQEILNFSSKISQQNEEIAAKSAAIEKYKKAIARFKEKESPLSSNSHSMVNRRASVVTALDKQMQGVNGNKTTTT